MRHLTHIALAKSLAQVAEWWRSGIELTVSVNVSVRDLTDTSFATVVADLLRANDLPARATIGVADLGSPSILIEVVVTAAA